MKMTHTLTLWLPTLIVATWAVALMPAAAHAQSGILHKRSYVPAPMVAPPGAAVAASSAATVSSLPADAAPGVVVGVPGSSADAPGFVPGFPGKDAPGFDGGVVVPLPAPIDLDDIVHILPYPFEPVGPPPASGMPATDTTGIAALNSQLGMQTAAAAPPHAVPRILPQPGARGLPERAVGVRPSGITAPGPRTPAPAGGQAARGRSALHLQPVGVERVATPPRWRDRLRFSWPGGGK